MMHISVKMSLRLMKVNHTCILALAITSLTGFFVAEFQSSTDHYFDYDDELDLPIVATPNDNPGLSMGLS